MQFQKSPTQTAMLYRLYVYQYDWSVFFRL